MPSQKSLALTPEPTRVKSCTTLLHATGNGPGSANGGTSKVESALGAELAVITAAAVRKTSEHRLYLAKSVSTGDKVRWVEEYRIALQTARARMRSPVRRRWLRCESN